MLASISAGHFSDNAVIRQVINPDFSAAQFCNSTSEGAQEIFALHPAGVEGDAFLESHPRGFRYS